jgi:hypothetical protein
MPEYQYVVSKINNPIFTILKLAKMKRLFILFFLIIFFVISSCTNNLSRSSSQKTIFENLPKELQTISVQFGRSFVGERIEGPSKRMNYNGWTESSATAELQIIGKLIVETRNHSKNGAKPNKFKIKL